MTQPVPEQVPSPERIPGAVSQNTENGCYRGSDAELDQLRDLLRAGWSQWDASWHIFGPGTLSGYVDYLADICRAWELVTQLIETTCPDTEQEAA